MGKQHRRLVTRAVALLVVALIGASAGPAGSEGIGVSIRPTVDWGSGAPGVSVGATWQESAPAGPCGALDKPETGIQGDVPLADQLSGRARQGYNCGVAVVGVNSLGERGSNANMAWSDDCAYVAGDGVAVVDVSDPTRPEQVDTLHGPGSDDAFETIAAIRTPDRALLAAGRYGLFFDFQLANEGPVDLYDITDCARPRFLTTMSFPISVHNLTFSPDGRTLWSTLPLQAYDVSDPANPQFKGNLQNDLAAHGVRQLEYAHEVWTSPDGRLVYIGGQVVGDERSYTIDVEGWPANPPTVVASYPGPGHSIRDANVGGRHFLVRSDESVVSPTAFSCVPSVLTPAGGVAQPFLTDITDEAHPTPAGTMRLAINDLVNCPAAVASGVSASSHYQDVDDPTHTSFVMVSMWNAGLRIFDVRDPAAPREVAYFNPGQFASPAFDQGAAPLDGGLNLMGWRGLDQAWAHIRYVPETGQIWLTTRLGGFWVLELEPQIRALLGLPARPAYAPDGGSPRPDGTPMAATAARNAGPIGRSPAVYCTLGKF
jgi:hypothetical protein